jgi:hypothetical protein
MTGKKMMNLYKVSLTVVMMSSLLLGISSCSNSPPQNRDRSAQSTSQSSRTSAAIQSTISAPSPSSPPQVKASPSASPPSASPLRSQSLNAPTHPPAKSVVATTAASQSTVTVTIYKIDSQCETLVPEKVAVSEQQPMEAAISKALAQWDTADFSLAGYRVSVDPESRVATVDLRVSPNSKRQLESLSSCEQLALLGAINKTLTGNPQWKIQSVRFTEQGEEVVL